ncbi:MAG: type II secretion system F family protein [Candidatus Aenigmatarchaeota archaeon]
MDFYTRLAFRLFGDVSSRASVYFADIKSDLKKARMKISIQEYLSKAILTTFFVFLIPMPILSFLFGFIFQAFLFAFITSITVSIFIALSFFIFFLNYPKLIIKRREKIIDYTLPFASLYLSTVASSKLPFHKSLETFSKFSGYGPIVEEMNLIISDMKVFGLDVNTALERAVERSPSKNFKELLWGILSTIRAGGDLATYLKEKARNFMAEYRRKIYEFSHTLTVYIEIYLTAIIIGAIFFTILTAIISGITGGATDIIFVQFILIFLFIPLVSTVFIFLIKSSSPGGE